MRLERSLGVVGQQEQRRNAGKYSEPLEPPSEDDGERGLPWLTRMFHYWMYVGMIFCIRRAMTSENGTLAFEDCDSTSSMSFGNTATLESPVVLGMECLW